MLVILTDRQILSTKQVCGGCLMADSCGLPRWREGELCCGHLVENTSGKQPKVYECEMGFRVTEVN